ncbi:hypothetical protein [Pseudomonas caspiana]|nr:hypothetical protein [Pseudomonas caspiana]
MTSKTINQSAAQAAPFGVRRTVNVMMRNRAYSLLMVCALSGTSLAAAEKRAEGAIGSSQQNKISTLQYWTLERMKEAEREENQDGDTPISGPILTPGGDDQGHAQLPQPYTQQLISRVTGQLFFLEPVSEKNKHCTASVLQSQSKRLIIAAAHCFMAATLHPPLQWNQRLMFVPAYDGNRPVTDNLRAPYGLWPISRSYVSADLEEDPGLAFRIDHDLGVAGVFDQLSARIEEVVGGGFAPFINDGSELLPLVNMLGYPAKGRYLGATQYWCLSTTQTDVPALGLPNCKDRHGHSGGPILLVNDASLPLEATQIVGVVHGGSQTRLLPDLYPAIGEMANRDHQHDGGLAP